ncbi:hypothetical protein [Polaromonas sp.]
MSTIALTGTAVSLGSGEGHKSVKCLDGLASVLVWLNWPLVDVHASCHAK